MSKTVYHVSKVGNDANPGTKDNPFRHIKYILGLDPQATVVKHGH